MKHQLRVACLPLLLLLAGCQGWQSSLDPKGPQAQVLADLFWIFTAVCSAVWLLVMVALTIAVLRRHRERLDPLSADPVTERRSTIVVAAAVALTAVIMLALTGLSYATQKELFASKSQGLTLKLTGHQWWWEVNYEDPQPDRTFTTANEIHVPTGEPVTIKLVSSDVIHSFWVPSLMGKLDLIPGRENEIQFVAERPGIYRGQCAEFCGWQHAHMSLLFVARPKEEFEAWREQQLRAADPPVDEGRKRGQEVFLSKPCMMCHTIRGTSAGGKVGPDLTHIGSRRYIAAGTLPLSRGTLAAWITDPHSIKPGVNMPLVQLEPDELNSLAGYLEGLE
jgi:cytochrome c oxidase subunit 2